MRRCRSVICLAVVTGTVSRGQLLPRVPTPQPDPVASLARIQKLAQPYCDAGDAGACSAVEHAGKLARGLSGAWALTEDQKKQPIPKEYAENIALLANRLENATTANRRDGAAPPSLFGRGKAGKTGREPQADSGFLKTAFFSLSQDLSAKETDCHTFGMGRLVPVTVRTVRSGATSDPGWELFYSCSFNGLTGGEIRAPGLTDTTIPIPPAASCTFRARRAGRQAQAGPVPVFERPAVTVEIPVP